MTYGRSHMSHLYILENKIPVPVEDGILWGRWFENADKQVANTSVDKLQVSTVFVGVAPLLFETMVFEEDKPIDKFCRRYCTWEDAQAGHDAVVALIRSAKSASHRQQ